MTAQTKPAAAQLAAPLRAISNRSRLQIIGLLDAAGQQDAPEMAGALGLSVRSLRRHLSVLEDSKLVRRIPANGRYPRFALDQRNAMLLTASFLSLLGQASFPKAGRKPDDGFPVLNEPPSAMPSSIQPCLQCQNSDYVRQMLENLDRLQQAASRYQSRLQQLSSQVLTAHEEERKRVARELHDDTAQALTSILVRLRLLERSVEQGQLPDGLQELRDLTVATLEGVRRLAGALRPTALDDLGLVAALHSFVQDFSPGWALQVEITSHGLQRRLPPEVELALYRVVQEALSNVAKHARASSASVRLQRTRDAVTVVVEDNGSGFDVKKMLGSGERGLGLFGMQERLALIGGTLRIDSSPQQGTRIIAWVPLARRRHRRR
jgi:signal transduction histidine kinase